MLLSALKQAQVAIRRCVSNSALPDFLSMRRSDLVHELCQAQALVNDSEQKADGVEPWVRDFMTSSRIMESYIVLQSQKTSKTTMLMFENVDPDLVGDQSKVTDEKEKHIFLVQELIFLRQFSSMLRRAGYDEVPKNSIKERLDYRHRYERIMMKVPHKHYKYIRIWVKGQKKFSKNPDYQFHDKKFNDRSWEGLLHQRVVIVSKGPTSSFMHIKGYKDLPQNHFELIMPEAKLSMPWYQRIQMGVTMTCATVYSYLKHDMSVFIDFEFKSFALTSIGLSCYDFFRSYKSEQRDYVLTWKRMLYYKNTANNSGLVVKIVNDAYERQLKEALLVYGTALKLDAAGATFTEEEVIRSACEFLSDLHETKVEEKHINFPAAFLLLRCLGVLDRQEQDDTKLDVISPEDAVTRLTKGLLKLAA